MITGMRSLRQLQKLRGSTVGAISTLSREPNRTLQTTIGELCGDAYVVDDAARVVRAEPALEASKLSRRPALPAPDAVITVLRKGNPKREGSASHARYVLPRSGVTVAEYLAAAGSRGRRTLHKALRQAQVLLEIANDPYTSGLLS
jgi:hypothetical protein